MPPRVRSPYDPGKAAVVEPIVQPLYSSVVITVIGQSKATLFSENIGTAAGAEVDTNLDTPNILPNPKIFVILGLRLHYTQLGAASEVTNAFQMVDILKIAYSYWFLLFIGSKDYLRVPAFYLSSGLGYHGAFQNTNTSIDQGTGGMGWPTFHSYFKLDRHPITIPPQQNFRAEMNKGIDFPSNLSQTRKMWSFLEGDFGREVQ